MIRNLKKYAALASFAASALSAFAQYEPDYPASRNQIAQSYPEEAEKEAKPLPPWLEAISDYFTRKDGETHHLEPFTKVALGLGLTRLSFAAAADLPVGVPDLLSVKDNKWKEDGRIKLNFNEIYNDPDIKKDGLDLNFAANLEDIFQIEVALENEAGWGFSIGSVISRFDLRINDQIFRMLSEGITAGTASYGASISGAVFAETFAFNYHQKAFFLPGLFFSVTGAHYVPVIYIPKSDLYVRFVNGDNTRVGVGGTAEAYMPLAPGGETGSSKVDIGGLDMSLQAEYALFPILDVGMTVLNIPVIPSALHTKASLSFDPDKNTIMEIDDLVNGGFSVDIGNATSPSTSYTTGELWVTRPMRFDWYLLFRPGRTDIVVLRPNIGFTVLNPSEQGYFNLGLETQLNAGRAFTLSYFTGGEDGLFRNRLGMDLRLGGFARWILNLEMRSQSYAGSWTLKGLKLELALKFGGGFNGLTNF